ncbi:MAG: gliding motility-associated C-terminal domain-containing protein [Bacteroidota bacterium]
MKSIPFFFMSRVLIVLTCCSVISYGQAQEITDVSPHEACIGEVLTVLGTGLDAVVSAKVGGKGASLIDSTRTPSSFQIIIPNTLVFTPDNSAPKGFNVVGTTSQGNLVLRDSLTVSPVLDVSISLGNNQDDLFCEDQSVDLLAESSPNNSSYTYSWTPSTGLNVTDESEVVASPDMTTSYVVEVNSGASCSYYDTITLQVRSLPVISSVQVKQPFCGSPASVEIMAQGSETLEYRLSSNDDTFGFTENPLFENLPQGTYDIRIRYTSQPNCALNSNNHFTIEEDAGTSEPSLQLSSDRICAGETISVSTQAPSEAMITWDFGSEAIPGMATGPGPHEVQFNLAGSYTIHLTSEIDTCIKHAEKDINIDPSPTITVTPNIPQGVQDGDSIQLILQAPGEEVLFSWEMDITGELDNPPPLAGTDSVLQGVFRLAEGQTVALIEFQIYSLANGCEDSLYFSFQVSKEPIVGTFFAPDLFTPNGDGINDSWAVVLPEGLSMVEHQVQIFNRSGGLIFEGDASQKWNGVNFRNGISSPDGPYWFIVQHVDNPGQVLWTGAITLLR